MRNWDVTTMILRLPQCLAAPGKSGFGYESCISTPDYPTTIDKTMASQAACQIMNKRYFFVARLIFRG
jgi:hypothetical protein